MIQEEDLIYSRRNTPVGIRVEEVYGGARYSAKLREAMARQVWSEKGKNGYQTYSHYDSGAPALDDDPAQRISVTHCPGMFAVAQLPRTPETDLEKFALRTALGIDAEDWERDQVMRVRERFLNPEELALVPKDDLRANILAWTAKEAALKAGMDAGVDMRQDIVITRLPDPATGALGEVTLTTKEAGKVQLELYSYDADDICVTLAYSPKCAKYKKSN